MSNSKSKKRRLSDIGFASRIAEGTEVQGAYSGRTDLLIEGTLHGDVSVEGTVMVATRAVVEGDLTAVNAVVNGRVTGDVRAKRAVEVRPQAIIQGSVIGREAYIAVGAKVAGEIIAHGRKGVVPFKERRHYVEKK